MVGGALSDRKGVNVPDILLNIPALTKKDRIDLDFALAQGVDFIGLSFVQRAEDVAEAKTIAAGRAWIMSKLEKPQALEELDAILALSDAVMVARGDLGVELPPEEVPLAQKRIVRAARALGKPVVVATQMLESMINAPAPTRAEASDVAGAVFDGADAVMLSAETAAGQFPVEAVSIMDRIVTRVEQDEGWRLLTDASCPVTESSVSGAIAAAASQVARSIDAKTIAAFTASGSSALRIARQRPVQPIMAIVTEPQIARRLAVSWGVHAVMAPDVRDMARAVEVAARLARDEGLAGLGDSVVVAGGIPFGQAGTTNSLRVVTIK
jgi:pyruvate kinase